MEFIPLKSHQHIDLKLGDHLEMLKILLGKFGIELRILYPCKYLKVYYKYFMEIYWNIIILLYNIIILYVCVVYYVSKCHQI